MKCLIVLSAVVAVALAKPGFLGAGVVGPAYAAAPAVAVQPAAPIVVGGIHPGLAAYGPARIAVGPGGYVVDTPDVAVARGAHLTAVAQTRARDAAINGAALAAAAAAGAYAAPAVVAAPAVSAAPAVAAYAPSIAALGPAGVLAGHGLLGGPAAALAAAKAAYHG